MLTSTRKYELLREFKELQKNTIALLDWLATLSTEEQLYLADMVYYEEQAPVSPDVSTVLKG